MKKRIYWKDIWLAITKSKGRFFSIFSLMMIGAIALVGLKVTTPNMERTAQDFVDKYQMMDVAVMADYGLDDVDVRELSGMTGVQVEFGYLTDVTVDNTHQAVRIFSKTKTISQFELVQGQMPKSETDIVLAESMAADYKIGDKIDFSLTKDSPLKEKTFTITGFARSSEIWDNQSMGSSSVGTGELTGYALTNPEAFDSDVYMIARIKYDDLGKLNYYSSTYQDKVANYQKDLEKILTDNGQGRLSVLKSDAQKKIDDGQTEVTQSEKELSDADQKIKDGESQLADGEQQLAKAKEDIASAETQLAISGQQLANSKTQLNNTAQELAIAKSQLDSNKSTLDATNFRLIGAADQLALAGSVLEEKDRELSGAAAQISDKQLQWATAKRALEEEMNNLIAAGQDPLVIPEIIAKQEQLAQQEAFLTVAMQAYEAGFAEYQAGFAQYQEQKTQYEAGRQAYETRLSQYNAGLAQYQTGLSQYNAGLAQYQEALRKYEAGQAELVAAKEEISKKESQLTKSKEDLTQSKETFEDKSGDADKKIKEAKADLQTAQSDVEALEKPTYRVYSRYSFPGGSGYKSYSNATESISAVGNVFPVVLYLVAAMVTLTTMTRFVDEERNNAGILRALGYTKRQIIAKFVIYGFVASLAGTLVGILAGNLILSPMIANIITKSTVIGQANLYFYPSWTLLSLALALLSAVLPTYLVARKELTEEPAQLLLGKPPVSGSTILLEKIPFIWERLSFTHKVTARNIFRYKQRMLMTIFGVAGSVALLFAGLGIQSSISGVADTQFGELIAYDMMVVQKEKASSEELVSVEKLVQSSKVKSSSFVQLLSLSEKISGVEDEQQVSLIVPKNAEIADFIQLRTRSKESISLTNQGAVLTEKLANLYGVEVGDQVTLHVDDKAVKVRVAAISEMYAGHFVYMTADYYEKVTGQTYLQNAYLVTLKHHSSKEIQDIAAEFLDMDGVAGVAQNTALIALINTTANSLQSVMLILIVLSVLLAVVILYNLTNINVAERIRELSTIKVLGFHNKEVTMYIYRETVVLSIIGIVAGLGLGHLLHRLILQMIGSSAIMFNPAVATYVFISPIISIVGILAVLGVMVNYKLRHVDMLEALKSVE